MLFATFNSYDKINNYNDDRFNIENYYNKFPSIWKDDFAMALKSRGFVKCGYWCIGAESVIQLLTESLLINCQVPEVFTLFESDNFIKINKCSWYNIVECNLKFNNQIFETENLKSPFVEYIVPSINKKNIVYNGQVNLTALSNIKEELQLINEDDIELYNQVRNIQSAYSYLSRNKISYDRIMYVVFVCHLLGYIYYRSGKSDSLYHVDLEKYLMEDRIMNKFEKWAMNDRRSNKLNWIYKDVLTLIRKM